MVAQHPLEVRLARFNVPGPALYHERVHVLRGRAGAGFVVSPDGGFYEESAVPDVDVAETVQLRGSGQPFPERFASTDSGRSRRRRWPGVP